MAIFGILFEIIISSLVGILLLIIHPRWKLNFFNVIAFNIGSFVFLITTSFIMSLFMRDAKKLNSTFEVISYLFILFIVFVTGGCLGIIFGQKYKRK
jgi:uncharacterized membrane protein